MDFESSNFIAATRTALNQLTALAVHYSLSVIGAIILLIVGWMLARLLSRWLYEAVSRFDGVDLTLAQFFANVLRYGIMTLVFVTVLGQFGVQTTSIVAALGAAGLAIGLALQGTLQNIAAGIMLLVLRPLRVGEYIVTPAVNGTVMEVGLFATELKTAEGLYLLAPNSILWNVPITNHSRRPQRLQELTIAVANDTDLDLVKRLLLGVVERDERVEKSPAPRVFSDDLAADKTTLKVAYWAKTAVWTEARRDLIDRMRNTLIGQGIVLK
ncbi:mechanosensitive ion channel family protein [Gellertiella hungarica]|uniref:Small-conductance mechanosensitive channel n=1 Tax=Gellertiella hungarica TaxID=1572859 RepID=A0A7W6J8M4_9HYPH|nr:mechanosensitive ion channel domain-containing protein [Gellertiella hungarica]MBB4066810.1 small conductance mechanosensitive channel [Gellertiella hungarica]